MQTFLPFLLVWDESKTVLENLQACFRLTAQLLDNKRTGKQRVEAMQLLNILLGRNADSSWKRHPVLHMWKPWTEALKLYYNCFLEEWMARGFVNNLPLEDIDEEALTEQGIPPFLSNKHFVDRHRANLMTKHPDFYEKYEWGVEPRQGYYWYLDGVYILTKYGKRYESDLSGDQAPPEPEPPVRKRKPRVKKEVKEEEEEEEDEEAARSKKKRKKDNKTKVKKEEALKEEEKEERGNGDDDDFMPPKKPKRRREVKVEKNEEDEEDVVNNVSEKGKERDDDDDGEEQQSIKTEEEEEEEEEEPKLRRRAKRKPNVSELVASFAFPPTTTSRRVAKRTKRGDATLLSADQIAALD